MYHVYGMILQFNITWFNVILQPTFNKLILPLFYSPASFILSTLLLQNEGLFNSCPKAWHDVWSGDKIRQECLDTVNTAGRGGDGW